MLTIKAKCLAVDYDINDYTNYIFENYDATEPYERYILCVKYPNWNSMCKKGWEGYLTIDEHVAGEDYWYKGNEKTSYNYTHIQFVKFIRTTEKYFKL